MRGVDSLNIPDITVEFSKQTAGIFHLKNCRASKRMPSRIRRSWVWWKGVARIIGDFNARVILTLFYFIFLAPFALAIRFLTDPLAIKDKSAPSWGIKSHNEESLLEQAKRQF